MTLISALVTITAIAAAIAVVFSLSSMLCTMALIVAQLCVLSFLFDAHSNSNLLIVLAPLCGSAMLIFLTNIFRGPLVRKEKYTNPINMLRGVAGLFALFFICLTSKKYVGIYADRNALIDENIVYVFVVGMIFVIFLSINVFVKKDW